MFRGVSVCGIDFSNVPHPPDPSWGTVTPPIPPPESSWVRFSHRKSNPRRVRGVIWECNSAQEGSGRVLDVGNHTCEGVVSLGRGLLETRSIANFVSARNDRGLTHTSITLVPRCEDFVRV